MTRAGLLAAACWCSARVRGSTGAAARRPGRRDVRRRRRRPRPLSRGGRRPRGRAGPRLRRVERQLAVRDPRLAAHHRVIAVDLKGFGWTSRARRATTARPRRRSWCGACSTARTSPTSRSSDTRGARRSRSRWRSRTPSAPGASRSTTPTSTTTRCRASSGGRSRAASASCCSACTTRSASRIARRSPTHDERWITQARVDHVEAESARPGTVAAALATARGHHFAALHTALRSFVKPVLLLWGEDDQVTPVRFGHRLANELLDAELRVYPRLRPHPDGRGAQPVDARPRGVPREGRRGADAAAGAEAPATDAARCGRWRAASRRARARPRCSTRSPPTTTPRTASARPHLPPRSHPDAADRRRPRRPRRRAHPAPVRRAPRAHRGGRSTARIRVREARLVQPRSRPRPRRARPAAVPGARSAAARRSTRATSARAPTSRSTRLASASRSRRGSTGSTTSRSAAIPISRTARRRRPAGSARPRSWSSARGARC